MLPGVCENERQLVPDLFAHRARDRDAAWFAKAFKAGRDIDAIAEQVPLLRDHIAKIDPHPKRDALILRHVGVSRDHPALNLDRATHGLYGTDELDQHAIACRLDDAPTMFLDLGIDEFAPMRLEVGEGAFLISPHETAVADDISRHDGSEPAFNPQRGGFLRHGFPIRATVAR